MKHTFLSLQHTLLIVAAICASHAFAYKKQSIDITVNGQQRNMIVYTPSSLPAKSPLFIVTHGMNQSPEYQLGADKMYEMIDTAKFVITYLRSNGNTWDTGGTNDQAFVSKTIDEMATRFDIDKERVYWSGFSMGSMLIHHCIANMQNKIAAFAPTSGIQFSEQPWNNCSKPVNLLEVIAYGDDVFGYEQYGIHAYIENYAKHDKHTNYTKTTGYKPISSSWFDGDLEKWTGGPNGGEVWLYSYNNGGHWPMDLNRHLIWNFCKRFCLNQPTVRITKPAGETTHLCMAPQDEATFPDITVKATAKAPNGKVVKMDIYDGKTLLQTNETANGLVTIEAPASGKHNLRVEVTDNKEKTASASCLVNYIASKTSQNLHLRFNTEGVVPQDWYVSNGSTKRIGGGTMYTDGARILRFTNSTRAFDYGLLVQNSPGRAKVAWAKYGVGTARSTLTLHAGHYAIKYKVVNWNQPEFSPVILSVQDVGGEEIATETFTPTVNIGGNTANKFAKINFQTFEFDVPATGEYIICFYTAAQKNADFVLGQVSIQAKEFATGIRPTPDPSQKGGEEAGTVYDLNGRKISLSLGEGRGGLRSRLYIINGRKVMVK